MESKQTALSRNVITTTSKLLSLLQIVIKIEHKQ
jgi:hypothetical protein